MTHDELERAMEFLLAQQAKSNSETESLRADIRELTDNVAGLTDNVAGLTGNVAGLTGSVAELTADVAQLTATIKGVAEEMREGFNNLIIANEVTRDLANRTAELAINNSRRLTRVEQGLKLE